MTPLSDLPRTLWVYVHTRSEYVNPQHCLARGWRGAPILALWPKMNVARGHQVQTIVQRAVALGLRGHGADSRDGTHIVRAGCWVWGALTGAREMTAGGRAGGQQAGRKEGTHRP